MMKRKIRSLKELEGINAATSQAAREGRAVSDPELFPYFGYYEVDLFECPPFLMFLGNDCPRGWNILFDRYFEPQSMKLWCRLAQRSTSILDVGAHVGVYALAAAALRPDLKIHAFEPNPYAFARLRMHKLVNAFDNIVEHTVALADGEVVVDFGWFKKPTLQIASGAGIGRLKADHIESTVARATTLDGMGLIPELGPRPLMKIDVEGAEAAVFRGMPKALNRRPEIILESFSQRACDVINDLIAGYGYSVYKILEKSGGLIRQEKLLPCDAEGSDFNQLLTTRSPEKIAALAQ